MWENFSDETATSSSFIRDLVNLGAEFCGHSWEAPFCYIDFDHKGMKVPLPRLVVESMQTISEFAEGTLNRLLSSSSRVLTS
jgi:hypothetical protein